MSRFAVTWSLDGRPHALGLDQTTRTEYLIGREPGVDIVVPLATVSRRQARLVWDGSRFTLENLSATNATRVDGRVVAGVQAIADGNVIEASDVALTFHDLATGDRMGGPRCSHCGRENASGETECWFCGTSMVNALTGVRTRLRLVLRLVDASGTWFDLVEGQAIRPRDAGGWDIETAVADVGRESVVAIANGQVALADGMGVGLENADGEGGAPGTIATGDVLVVGDHRYAAIAR